MPSDSTSYAQAERTPKRREKNKNNFFIISNSEGEEMNVVWKYELKKITYEEVFVVRLCFNLPISNGVPCCVKVDAHFDNGHLAEGKL